MGLKSSGNAAFFVPYIKCNSVAIIFFVDLLQTLILSYKRFLTKQKNNDKRNNVAKTPQLRNSLHRGLQIKQIKRHATDKPKFANED